MKLYMTREIKLQAGVGMITVPVLSYARFRHDCCTTSSFPAPASMKVLHDMMLQGNARIE
jgi:hypothetical protein